MLSNVSVNSIFFKFGTLHCTSFSFSFFVNIFIATFALRVLKGLKGSSRELMLYTFEYFQNTDACQDRTHTQKRKNKNKTQKKCI